MIKAESAIVENYSDHLFLVMWCCEGLECVFDITTHEKEQLWKTLKGQETSALPNLNSLVLRARYNSQRHYEIYTVTATSGITSQDLTDMFNADPQYAADLIRARGHKIYSDRASASHVKIV